MFTDRSLTSVGERTSDPSTARSTKGAVTQAVCGPLSVFTSRTRTRSPGSVGTFRVPAWPSSVCTPS
jgi:hypothetical protein